jgi:hypothetical protein
MLQCSAELPPMNFDPKDLIEANLSLLQEASVLTEPRPGLLITVATWGRGADPELLLALQPYRHGLGFNGSIVARVPQEIAERWLPVEALKKLEQGIEGQVYSAVFKDWVVESLN